MCRKLIQVYACGHTKTVCTTACPHALETANALSRSNSTLSTTIASPKHRGQASPHLHSPAASPLSTKAPTLSTSTSLARLSPQISITEPQPNYCAYYFPHNLPQSRHPCVDCFVLPEWEHRAKRWMTWYRGDHVLEKEKDVERLSGVGHLRDKKAHEGLLNVFVDGDDEAGRIV